MMGKEQEDISYTKVESSIPSDKKVAMSVSEEQMEQNTEQMGINEVDELLKDEKFLFLRKALAQNGIRSLDQLRALKLWPFMNYYDLYSIGVRQKVLEDVDALLHPLAETDESRLFILHVGDNAYKGDTTSSAFLRFCDDMLRRYPLQLRLLVGTRMCDGIIPIHITKDENQLQKLNDFSAYIRGDLSKEEVVRYAEWICGKCGEADLMINVIEPAKTLYESRSMEMSHVAESTYHVEQEQADGHTRTNESEEYDEPVLLEEDKTAVDRNSESAVSSEAGELIKPQFFKLDEVNPDVAKIEQIILRADINGMTYENLRTVSGLTVRATNQLVAEAMHIVDMDGKLIHQDAFVDWEDGANQLEDILEKLMQKNDGYVSAKQLYEYAKVEMSMFINDNNLDEERLVYDMARHLFEKVDCRGRHYRFSGKSHISRQEDGITSNLDVYKKYAKDQGGIFSISALEDYLGRIGMGTGNLHAQMRVYDEPIFFCYESGIFMYVESMHIDSAWMDTVKKALEALLTEVGGHIILRSLPDTWLEQLPPLPESSLWTPLLLQSVLRCYSRQLGARTIPAMERQSLDTLHAMLVIDSCMIQNFGDVVVTWLMDNEIEQHDFEAEELRGDMVDAGIIQGNELIWNMPKALKQDERFAWDASGLHVTIEAI